MMKPITDLVRRKGVVLSDGAWGTMLFAKGFKPGECPELWNVTRRDDVLEIAKGYVDAGSDVIQTNTFGGNKIKLAHYGLDERTIELNEAGARISREAAGSDVLVMGSMGPTGKLLLMGEVTGEEVFDAFRLQVMGLDSGGVDALCIETFMDIEEAVIAINAAKLYSGLEIACSFTFDKTVSGEFRTFMGHTVEEVVSAIKGEGVDIIGTNCGNRIENMIAVVREIRIVEPDLPIMAYANAGVPSVEDGTIAYPDSAENMASLVPFLVQAGANIIGGCCGTTPEYIKAMGEEIKNLR